jgi:hypothetical protein
MMDIAATIAELAATAMGAHAGYLEALLQQMDLPAHRVQLVRYSNEPLVTYVEVDGHAVAKVVTKIGDTSVTTKAYAMESA